MDKATDLSRAMQWSFRRVSNITSSIPRKKRSYNFTPFTHRPSIRTIRFTARKLKPMLPNINQDIGIGFSVS